MGRPCVNDRAMTGAERAARYRVRVKVKAAKFIPGDEWGTPAEYIALAREVMGQIDLDPASNEHAQRTVQARQYFTREDSGLVHPWVGRVWLNPPYSHPLLGRFVDKMVSEWQSGNVTEAVTLTQARTDTRWFRKLAGAAICYCNTDGRIKFETPDGVGHSPPNGSTFFYFGKDPDKFFQVFRDIGSVVWSLT